MTLFPVCFLAASYLLILPSTLRRTESITNLRSLKIQASFSASQSAVLLDLAKKSEELKHALPSLLCTQLKCVLNPWLFLKRSGHF